MTYTQHETIIIILYKSNVGIPQLSTFTHDHMHNYAAVMLYTPPNPRYMDIKFIY